MSYVPGDWIVAEAYSFVDPDLYTDVLNDMMLKKYLTALIKRQWGQNLSKYDSIQMPGGTTLRGPDIFTEGNEAVIAIEEEIRDGYSNPIDFFVG